MRRMVFLAALVLAPQVRAQEQDERPTIIDERSGLVIELPDGWSRETKREKGSIRFAGIYDLSRTRYALFTVETGSATGYDEAAWFANEKAAAAKFLKSVTTPWTTEPVVVGGRRTTRFAIGGKAAGEKEFDVRLRGCAVVHNDVFFRILEVSYGGAHEEAADALRAMWEAVRFQAPNPLAPGDEEEDAGERLGAGEGAGGGIETPKGEPIVIEDKAGNFKLSLPPGWKLERTPQEDDGIGLRLLAAREASGTGQLARIEVQRIDFRSAEIFEREEPSDVLTNRLTGLVESFYGNGSAKILRPEIDARVQLGGADKSCGYEYRGLPLDERAKIAEAEKLIARGDKTVTVPDFKPLVLRGRLAMISPFVYLANVHFARSVSDDAQLLTEVNQILDSWEFLSAEARPPPLASDSGPFPNTLADPANATERKRSKVHEYKKGAKVAAALKIDYVLPPGFQEADRVVDAGKIYAGAEIPVQVIAQDANNGWVWIKVIALSSKSLGSNEKFEDKKTTFETWISNFESQARGAGKMPTKPEKIKVGNLDGDGCELKGRISNFTATEINMVTIESGWWIKFELRTRGTGARTFADGIKTFMKKFRATKK